jgi:hypothetical protein
VFSAGGDKDRVSLAEFHALAFDLEYAPSAEDDVDLVLVVRLLAIRLRCDEHIDADLKTRRSMNDLVATVARSQPLLDALDVKRVRARERRADRTVPR